MSYMIGRKGQAYPITPRIFDRTVIRFTPVYATTNGDGAIGNGSFTGTWELNGNVMRLKLALVFGGTTVIGTGEVALPLPTGWTQAMIDTSKMPEISPFNVQQYVGGSKNASIALGLGLHVNNFLGNNAFISGSVAALAGAVPGDVFQFSIDVPFASFGPA